MNTVRYMNAILSHGSIRVDVPSDKKAFIWQVAKNVTYKEIATNIFNTFN